MIEIGDIVDVYFENVECEFYVEVLSKPQATGDCWGFKREDGTEVNVQSFSKIVKRKKDEERYPTPF